MCNANVLKCQSKHVMENKRHLQKNKLPSSFGKYPHGSETERQSVIILFDKAGLYLQ